MGGPPPRRDPARGTAPSSRPGGADPTEAWAPGGESLAEVAGAGPAGPRDGPRAASPSAGSPATPTDPVAGYGGRARDRPWSILVGHDGVFKVALLTLFDLPLERFWMWSFDLCGITVVEFRAGRPVLRAHNLTEHLAPRRRMPRRSAERRGAAEPRAGGALTRCRLSGGRGRARRKARRSRFSRRRRSAARRACEAVVAEHGRARRRSRPWPGRPSRAPVGRSGRTSPSDPAYS